MRVIDQLRALGLSSRAAREALQSGKVRVHGVPVGDGGLEVAAGLRYLPDAPRLTPGRDAALIHQDSHLAVLWKPSGMLSVPAPGRREGNILSAAGRWLGSLLPVHRLDEGTSGLMLVARTETAQLRLKAMFEAHTLERGYLSLAWGNPTFEERRVESVLVRDRGDGLRGTGEGPGKQAISFFRLNERLRGAALWSCTLETGRTHQIRIQLSEAGQPVLGDPLYGHAASQRACNRLALHSAILGFQHPFTGESLRFTAPLADDLEQRRRELQPQGK